MGWIIHIPAFDRIIMDILDFLTHHLIPLNEFRMTPFLPELVCPILFMCHF